jgi:hypothetical protein
VKERNFLEPKKPNKQTNRHKEIFFKFSTVRTHPLNQGNLIKNKNSLKRKEDSGNAWK